jgi:hypothetical protein
MKMKTEKEMEIECALFSAWLRISLLSQFHPAPGLDLGLFMYDRRQASLTSIYARPISVNGYNKMHHSYSKDLENMSNFVMIHDYLLAIQRAKWPKDHQTYSKRHPTSEMQTNHLFANTVDNIRNQ